MREMLKVYVPAILLIVAGFVVALRFVAPPPPKDMRIATGQPGGFYHLVGQKYRDLLAREGVRVELVETQGSVDNLRRLAAGSERIDVAFVQGGLSTDIDTSGLMAVAGVFVEPVWVLVRSNIRATRLAELRGRRVVIGAEGSGTRVLARQLLAANGVTERNTDFVELGTAAALNGLAAGEIEAAFVVAAVPSQPMVDLLARGAARLLSFSQADAYQMRFPFLVPVRLPMGAADLAANVPPTDVRLIAPTAALVVRDDIHPALITLLLETAREIHGGVQLFAPAGAFPSKNRLDYPLHGDAERNLDRGPSFLFRYLPFWIAVWVERMVVLIVPLVTVLIPVMRFAPPAYRWQVQRKIYRWYTQLRKLEEEARTSTDTSRRAAIRTELNEMETALAALKVPVSYAQQLYHLREHLNLVRSELR